jgi:hypothetical protein
VNNMTSERVLRGSLISLITIAMLPAGWVIGLFCGEHLTKLVLHLEGKSSSQDDLIIFIGTGAGMGAATATVVLPFLAWFLIRRLWK